MNTYFFEVKTGKVHLIEPGHDIDSIAGEFNIPAMNGIWKVDVTFEEGRVHSWAAYHNEHQNDETLPMKFEFLVDGGQFGIFDSSSYICRGDEEYVEFCLFCGGSLKDVMCDSIDGGFISRTGWGDGEYYGKAAYVDGQLVKFEIEFMSEYEDDEDELSEDFLINKEYNI